VKTSKIEKNQNPQLSPELQQQIGILNARITNVNLANADLLKAIETTFKTMATTIIMLQKENDELKNKRTEKLETSTQ
jgi:hypothetical protein